MPNNLKIDIINGAYSQMRVSGLTVNPSANDLVLALRRLEGLANELEGRNVCTGYYFEEDPDVNSPCGLDSKYWYAFECILAMRLVPDFGKGSNPDPILFKNASAGMSFLYSSTANPRQIQYPRRQSLGAGNALRRFNKFYTPIPEAPNTCATNRMIVGDIDDFVEHFESYLISPEIIDSYTIEADTGLTIVSDSLTTPDVFYRIQADSVGVFKVKIVATTDDGRIITRIIYFELTTGEETETSYIEAEDGGFLELE
jgi:hypothetical protein